MNIIIKTDGTIIITDSEIKEELDTSKYYDVNEQYNKNTNKNKEFNERLKALKEETMKNSYNFDKQESWNDILKDTLKDNQIFLCDGELYIMKGSDK